MFSIITHNNKLIYIREIINYTLVENVLNLVFKLFKIKRNNFKNIYIYIYGFFIYTYSYLHKHKLRLIFYVKNFKSM